MGTVGEVTEFKGAQLCRSVMAIVEALALIPSETGNWEGFTRRVT